MFHQKLQLRPSSQNDAPVGPSSECVKHRNIIYRVSYVTFILVSIRFGWFLINYALYLRSSFDYPLFVSYRTRSETSHRCRRCNKTFLFLSKLTTHQTVYSGEKPYLCPICSGAFGLSWNFNRHMWMHDDDHRNRYVCDVCEFGCQVRARLRKNLPTHTRPRPFGCSICPSRFSKRSKYDHHQRTVHRASTSSISAASPNSHM